MVGAPTYLTAEPLDYGPTMGIMDQRGLDQPLPRREEGQNDFDITFSYASWKAGDHPQVQRHGAELRYPKWKLDAEEIQIHHGGGDKSSLGS